ncbi:DUF4184 family protein [Streptomyces sp. 4N509B]|uniref:DUF4184 family protein n=1 Tax=Streptomyces sp. 4N509B TaxID=3457413 RepID=UPI003FCFC064
MPFTLSHPAAVLPLLRPPFSPAALVCGAMAPDAPYFLGAAGIPVNAQSWYEPFLNATASHSLSGLTVGVPYALALLTLYWLVRRPAADLLPARPARPARPVEPAERGGDVLRRAGWVLLSVVIGILTHLAWDSFTHADGYVVTHLSVMRSHVTGDLTVARVVQHLSTIGGLLAIVAHLWRRLGPAPTGVTVRAGLPVAARWGVMATLAVAAVAGAVVNTQSMEEYRGGAGPGDPTPVKEVVEGVLSDTATGGGAALACALTLYACAWWAHRAVRPPVPR